MLHGRVELPAAASWAAWATITGAFGFRFTAGPLNHRSSLFLGFDDAGVSFGLAEASIRLTRAWARPDRLSPSRRRPGRRRFFGGAHRSPSSEGGHTNFIVNQPRTKNTSIWKKIVAFQIHGRPFNYLAAPAIRMTTQGTRYFASRQRALARRRQRQARLFRRRNTINDERIGEGEQHGDTHTDQERRIDQAR